MLSKVTAMMIQLTEEQQLALEQHEEQPPCVINPRTHEKYVLIRSEVYEEIKTLLAEEQAEEKAWLERARQARLAWVRENPY
jgi:hypothetical protein